MNQIQENIQNLYDEPLSSKELIEAQNNLVQFFDLLIEIDREQKQND